MRHTIRVYINKILTYTTVGLAIFTLMFFISVSVQLDTIKELHGDATFDEVWSLFRFYLVRTFLFTFIIPLYEPILKIKKNSFVVNSMIHGLAIVVTVGFMFYKPGDDFMQIIYILFMGIVIYLGILGISLWREKRFINNANEIFKQNKLSEFQQSDIE